jgi:hypothetical protein
MKERAGEIGWVFKIQSPLGGGGTRIRVEKGTDPARSETEEREGENG